MFSKDMIAAIHDVQEGCLVKESQEGKTERPAIVVLPRLWLSPITRQVLGEHIANELDKDGGGRFGQEGFGV